MAKNILIILLCIVYSFCQKDGEYYKKLWYKNIKKELTWKRPLRNSEFHSTDNTCTDHGKYDFIIVGAGSAGAVLANRLSEIASWNILLLEAGGDQTEFSRIPAAFPSVQQSEINWGYLTVPQKNGCFGMNNNQCDFTRGKVLGGGSSVNAMMHVQGNRRDYDLWEEMGNEGWSYEHVKKYFRKSENATGVDGDKPYRGYDGPLIISYPEPSPPLLAEIIKGNEELNYKHVDYNGRCQIGVGEIQNNINFGRRYSTNDAYLQPIIKHRKNLKVLTNSLATKIILHKTVARGVEFIKDGRCYKVMANKEVIVSAGAVNSPQLLMLSGIGPEKHLESLGIKVVANLPVGQNLEDHPSVFNIPIETNVEHAPDFDQEVNKYANGFGWLTYSDVLELSFLKADSRNKDPEFPDVEIMYALLKDFNNSELSARANNYKEETRTVLKSIKPTYILMYFMLLHPESKGEVTLNSKHPTDFPNINPNYFGHPNDIEIIYEAIQKTMSLLQTPTFKSIDARLAPLDIKMCEHLSGKQWWLCVLRYFVQGMYHPCGTCRMGNDPKDSVVNHQLKVHGIHKLRVVDASVIPKITSGHLNSVAVMIGEKMSDEIKMCHGKM